MMDLQKIGQICREHRESLGFTQRDVAMDLDYSFLNISAFENGRNNNCKILVWYLQHGLTNTKFYEEE